MKRPLALILVALATAGVAACGEDDDDRTTIESTSTEETTTAAKGEPVDCELPPPEGAGYFDLFATDIDCAAAENVRQAWSTQCVSSQSPECSVIEGFSCASEQTGVEVSQITCTRDDDDAVVEFKVGA